MLPAESSRVEHESELAVVIGQTMRLVTARGALEGIAGYCRANDVTARDVQHSASPVSRAEADDLTYVGRVPAISD